MKKPIGEEGVMLFTDYKVPGKRVTRNSVIIYLLFTFYHTVQTMSMPPKSSLKFVEAVFFFKKKMIPKYYLTNSNYAGKLNLFSTVNQTSYTFIVL